MGFPVSPFVFMVSLPFMVLNELLLLGGVLEHDGRHGTRHSNCKAANRVNDVLQVFGRSQSKRFGDEVKRKERKVPGWGVINKRMQYGMKETRGTKSYDQVLNQGDMAALCLGGCD